MLPPCGPEFSPVGNVWRRLRGLAIGVVRDHDPSSTPAGRRGAARPSQDRAGDGPGTRRGVPAAQHSEELAKLGRLGVREDLVRRSDLVDAAHVHEDDPAADVAREAHLVRDHQQGHALGGELLDHREHLVDELRVEGRGDLVAEQGQRLHREGARDRDALLLAARELVGIAVELVLEADAVEHPARHRLGFGLGGLLHHRLAQHHVLARRQMREEVEALEDHPDLEPQRLERDLVGQERGAGDVDRARVDRLEAVHAAQQGRLAGAALADDGDHLGPGDVEIDALEDLVVAVALADLSDFYERH